MELRDFDKVAASWDADERRVRLAREVAAAMLATGVLAAETALLDYGCGTGLLTMELAPRVAQITGCDSSQGMLAILGAKVATRGFGNVRTEFLDFAAGALPGGSYDAIVSNMTLHHVADLERLLAAFAACLPVGGWLLLADLEKEDGSFHDDPTGIAHHGFSGEELARLLDGAGFSCLSCQTVTTVHKGEGRAYPIFLLVARKR